MSVGALVRLAKSGYPEIMARSIPDIPKKRGRPSTGGRGVGILVRLSDEQVDELDTYREAQPDKPSRPEALRRKAFPPAK